MSKIKIFALGGLNENGKNMYVVTVNDDIFVFDAGLKYDNDLKDAYFDRFEMHYYQKGFRRLNLSRYTANLLNEDR